MDFAIYLASGSSNRRGIFGIDASGVTAIEESSNPFEFLGGGAILASRRINGESVLVAGHMDELAAGDSTFRLKTFEFARSSTPKLADIRIPRDPRNRYHRFYLTTIGVNERLIFGSAYASTPYWDGTNTRLPGSTVLFRENRETGDETRPLLEADLTVAPVGQIVISGHAYIFGNSDVGGIGHHGVMVNMATGGRHIFRLKGAPEAQSMRGHMTQAVQSTSALVFVSGVFGLIVYRRDAIDPQNWPIVTERSGQFTDVKSAAGRTVAVTFDRAYIFDADGAERRSIRLEHSGNLRPWCSIREDGKILLSHGIGNQVKCIDADTGATLYTQPLGDDLDLFPVGSPVSQSMASWAVCALD